MKVLEIENPVIKYAKLAREAKPRYSSPEEYDKLIESLRDTERDLLGIEVEAKLEIGKQIQEIKQAKLIDFDSTNLPYPRLSLEPLGWKKEGTGKPIFAVYSLDDPNMRISIAYNRAARVSNPSLPAEMEKAICSGIPHGNNYYSTTTHSSKFSGIIPKDVKEKIRNAIPQFQETMQVKSGKGVKEVQRTNIFIIAEANWSTKTVTRNPDPLVVGWDGKSLRLIAHFDLTSLERYMKNEFPG